jgi:hypothetical protein
MVHPSVRLSGPLHKGPIGTFLRSHIRYHGGTLMNSDNSSCYFITMVSISYTWNFLDFLKFFDVTFICNGHRISIWNLKRKIMNE